MAAGASVQLPPSFASGPTGPIQIVIPSDKPQRTQALPLGSRRRQPRTKTLEVILLSSERIHVVLIHPFIATH